MKKIRNFLPLIILIIGLVLFIILGGARYISFNALSQYYQSLQEFVYKHYYLSSLLFTTVYIVAVSLSFPGAAILTLLGGFLFGVWWGTFWTIIASTIGAVITYFAVNSAFGTFFKRKVTGRLRTIQQGFSENEFYYLLTLRLLPIFPFFIINIASGIVGVRMRNFIIASMLGMAPCAFIYAWVGSSLGTMVVDQGQNNMASSIFLQPSIIIPLVLLAILSLLPVLIKKIKGKSSNECD